MILYIDNDLCELVQKGSEAVPTESFNRVIQRAMLQVQSSGRDEVTGANVLVAFFAERESHAVYFLQEQEMNRYDAVKFISNSVRIRHCSFFKITSITCACKHSPNRTRRK